MKTSLIPSARFFALLIWFGIGVAAPLHAQGSAPSGSSLSSLSGDVSNAATRASLEGAVVEIAGTNRRTLTDATGHFAFNHLPTGDYSLTVHYAGLDTQTRLVTVLPATPATPATASFALTSGVYQLEAFTITGEREGNAASITRQRNARNIINVVALDAYGDVADGNLGNFMQKLPGVAVQIAEGDAVGISLRGVPPSMSMTSLDGTQMSSAGSGDTGKLGDRSGIIDRIPAEFIKEVEVTKASTPDMDATGLGGGAKLVTKSAFDFKETSVTTFKGGYNKNTYRSQNRWTPTAAVTLMRKFGPENRIGITLSGSYTATNVTRDQLEITHPDTTNDYTTGIRFLDDTYHRIRAGAAMKLEYQTKNDVRLYFDSVYSRYVSNTDRYDLATAEASGHLIADYSVVSRTAIEGGAVPQTSARTNAGLAPGVTDRFVELLNRNVTNRSAVDLRRDNGLFLATGGTKKWGDTELNARATYNFNRYDREFDTFTATSSRMGFSIDQRAALDRPLFRQTYGPDIRDLNQSTGLLNLAYQHPRDRQITASVDLQHKLEIAGFRLMGKTGVKWIEAERTITSYSINLDPVGADGVIGRNAATGQNDDNLAQFLKTEDLYGLFDGFYPSMVQIDYGKIRRVQQGNSGYFRARPFTSNPRTRMEEDVTALYGMGEVTRGKLTVLAGARVERVESEGAGNVTAGGVVRQTTRNGGYTDMFPSVHARYSILPNLLARLSYSTTMNRPAIADLIPTTSVSTTGSGTVTQNNSDLGPQYARNYDAMIEYYFTPVGVLSVGAYKKNLTDFIATRTATIPFGPDNGFNGEYSGYDLVTKQNLSSAKVSGYEINYDQQLRNLPRPFNTLAVFINYMRVHTSGTYDNGQRELQLFIPKVFNVGFSYSIWRVQFRASYNYTAGYLNGANANPLLSNRSSSADNLDLNLQYRVTPHFNASINVANLFNEWPSMYTINPSRLTQTSVYGTRITFGLNGRF